MASIFVNICKKGDTYFVDIKSFIVLYILKLANTTKICVKVRIDGSKSKTYIVPINLNDFDSEIITDLPEFAMICKWPVILVDNYVVSGLCAVARQICRFSDKEDVKNLLGFREACLVACAETSVWTKFCEIDITETVEKVLSNLFVKNDCFFVPEIIVKYEKHLSQPVRMHNIYKIARNNMNDKSLKSSTPREDLNVPHDFAEGPYVSLADAILFPCFYIFFQYINLEQCHTKLPLIKIWFDRLISSGIYNPEVSIPSVCNVQNISVPVVGDASLYKADPNRVITVKHTKQYKIENAITTMKAYEGRIENSLTPFGFEETFDWQVIPLEVNPKGGSLPQKRADRKCQQLENLAKAVLKVVGDKKYRIVDFCSGSGHLGLLIAYLLPKSTVVLVENKEKSLSRAKETIEKLKLSNVGVVQSNLDYFVGSFNLGVALHACGVASDLVMQMCIKKKADFICCPCCYGGIKDCHEVSYPRSKQYQEIFKSIENQYFHLAHAADQTHEEENAKTKQGYFCMDVIDNDRRRFAEDCGYKVHLGKLQPLSCTNKNNLLVGLLTLS